MKQFNRSDSLGALVSNCSPKDDKNPNSSQAYSKEFQAMLDSFDEEDCAEESSLVIGKKRRLSLEQVKALEKSFVVENKVEPERKAKIAQELGLQPRQVAIWFQNRRARWKAKQMEKDYGLLKSDYDALKINYECLEQQKAVLNSELRELKEKLQKKNKTANHSVKEDALFSETEHNVSEAEQSKISPGGFYDDSEPTKLAHNLCNKNNAIGFTGQVELKDGLSDSDSSEFLVLNETNLHHHPQICPPYFSAGSNFSSSPSSSMNWFHPLWNTREIAARAYQQQFGRAEEQNLFGTTEESCNFFSVDIAPTLHWYNLDQSN